MIKAGDILIAKPFLQDAFFKRAVIFMCEHNNKGSMGFIINKPQGLLLKDIFPHLKHGSFLLFEGGPVSPNQLFYTHTLGNQLSDSMEIANGIYWGGNFFELSDLIEQGKVAPHQIRFYVGYSGWNEGQLEEEMQGDSWFTHHTKYNNLISIEPEDLWGRELVKINPGFKAFTDFAFDPSLN